MRMREDDGDHHCRVNPRVVFIRTVAFAIAAVLGVQFHTLLLLHGITDMGTENLKKELIFLHSTRNLRSDSLLSQIYKAELLEGSSHTRWENSKVTRMRNTRKQNPKNSSRVWPVLSGNFTGPEEKSMLTNSANRRNYFYYHNDNSQANTSGTILVPDVHSHQSSPPAITKKEGKSWKIVGFTDYNYKEIALRWYQRLQDLGYTEHIIVVHDNETAEYLDSLNKEYDIYEEGNMNIDGSNRKHRYRFESFFLPPIPKRIMRMKRSRRSRKAREMIFAARWQYILNQLEDGVSILLSDVDNLFHRHLNLNDDPHFWEYDVLHSYEDKYPVHIYERLGFTINGGLNWLQATPKAISFVQRFLDKCGSMCDDQIVLNELLAGNQSNGGFDIAWEPINNDTNGENPNRFFRPSRAGRSKITGHSFQILDSDLVFRGSHPSNAPKPGEFQCPPPEKNWISMPIVDPDAILTKRKRKKKMTRDSANAFKLALYDIWESKCGPSSSSNNRVQLDSKIDH